MKSARLAVQRRALVLAASISLLTAGGLGAASSWEVEELRPGAASTLARFKQEHPAIAQLVESAAGYAVFRRVGKLGFFIGTARGSGLVYEHGALTGHAEIKQVTVGPQVGACRYSQLVLFEDRAALERFKTTRFEMNAQASATIISPGHVTQNASYTQGVLTFVLPAGCRIIEASIGGQRFTFTSLDTILASREDSPAPAPPPPPPVTQRRGG